jgi:hypothetical protein
LAREDGDELDHQHVVEPMTMLDPKHPIYNFLVEYYGLKGLKGPKRLARWAPSIGLFFWNDENEDVDDEDEDEENNGSVRIDNEGNAPTPKVRRIESMEAYRRASDAFGDSRITAEPTHATGRDDSDRGIFLEGATPEDFALSLYLQGAEWVGDNGNGSCEHSWHGGKQGVLYRPIRFHDEHSPQSNHAEPGSDDSSLSSSNTSSSNTSNNNNDDDNDESSMFIHKKATSFVWYQSILETTLSNEAILHCYGLHEWAMQYHPDGAPVPQSSKYQRHLPLRVSRETINSTVERKKLRCTHVDALRFFAPAAGPLNHHGAVLERNDQLVLEQPGCVHAHMDLLKIALRIRPYCDPELLVDVLGVALKARALDVGASPYDCSAYSGLESDGKNSSILVIPVETKEGRALYKALQTELMVEANAVRENLLANYEAFGSLAFCASRLQKARSDPTDERFAKAEPGGRAWRHNLIDRGGGHTRTRKPTANRGGAN